MTKDAKQRYLLVAGSIIFSQGEDVVSAAPGNAMIVTEPGNTIPLRLLAKAQQGLQATFHAQMDDPDVIVRNVLITNIVDLGLMTDAEFNLTPQPIQEKKRHLQAVPKDDTPVQ